MPGRMTTEGRGGPGRTIWSLGTFNKAFRIRLRMTDTVTTALVHIKGGSQIRGMVALAHGYDMTWPVTANG
jgi:hypothetical protein